VWFREYVHVSGARKYYDGEGGQEHFSKIFRNRFRVPYSFFQELVDRIRTENHARASRGHPPLWSQSNDCRGVPAAPLELHVLAALRYLGRAWTFDDLAEQTGISRERHRCFFKAFISFYGTHVYDEVVTWPTSEEDIASAMHEYTMAGFPGAIASTDCTHVER
jgi:hypothetical protein